MLASVRGNAKSPGSANQEGDTREYHGRRISAALAGGDRDLLEDRRPELWWHCRRVGIMQTEVQEKRAWIPKDQFIEGLALVNTCQVQPGFSSGSF